MFTLSQFIQLIIIFILVYMSLYAIVNRICSCKEQLALAKAYNTYLEKVAAATDNMKDLEEIAKQFKDSTKNAETAEWNGYKHQPVNDKQEDK